MSEKDITIEYSRFDGYSQVIDDAGKVLGFIDNRTGEAIDAVTVTMPAVTKLETQQETEKKKRFADRDWRRRNRRADHISLGGVIMATCRENQFETLTPQDTARLVYLASYMDSDGVLKKKRTAAIKRSDLQEVLHLSRTATFHFWNAVKDKFISELSAGELKILDCFFKGELRGERERLTKVFIRNVRQLYRMTPTSQHVYLGYFFQVLYHVNVEYNILCKNPTEDYLYDVEPLTIQEFCEKAGYDQSQASRLRRACKKLQFWCDGRLQRLCAFVSNGVIDGEYMILNPHIIYAGTDYKAVEAYGLFFK